ncbi:hypothetical protein K402DRAFT_298838, partial [Aulographum hederae CBS 113979]
PEFNGVRSGKLPYAIPSTQALERAGKMTVQDAQGKSHTFKSIIEGTGSHDKHLILFIRHFFCYSCQEFLRHLDAHIPSSIIPASTKISIIGCGSPSVIPNYLRATGTPYTLYADPSKQLYAALGMGRTLDLGSRRPDYLAQQRLWRAVVGSVVQGITWRGGRAAAQGGDFWQVGGEWYFERKGEWRLSWCRRMQNTRDHAEVGELREVLGL